ncbi:MAG TPA: phosphatase [Candidatus Gemmiger avium]|nr:phosphatase [Candidatus Gemmiger avium]
MKKSHFAAVLLFLAAAVGALTAGYLYIRRREKELDEYESLLFSEDFDEDEATEADEPAADEPAAE